MTTERSAKIKRISELTKEILSLYKDVQSMVQMNGFKIDKPEEKYIIDGYFWGNKKLTCKGLTFSYFDSVTYLYDCQCPITKQKFVHAIGHYDNFNQMKILNLKLKKDAGNR